MWYEAWDIYNGVYDWSSKAWWQSKSSIPEIRGAVDRATAIFRKTLLRVHQFYNLMSESKEGRTKGQFSALLLDYWLEQSGVMEEMMQAIKVGLITGVIALKVWWQQVRDVIPELVQIDEPIEEFGVVTGTRQRNKVNFAEKTKGMFAVRAVDPFNIWMVPKSNKLYVIERQYTNIEEIARLEKEKIYEPGSTDRVHQWLTSSATLKETQEARRANELVGTSSQYIRQIEIFHYWGDIFNQFGRIAMPDASFSIIGKTVVVRKARANPFFHKRPPYIIGTPYKVPFAKYNRGMVEDVFEIAKRITELTNVLIDGAFLSAMKVSDVDIDQLEDPTDVNTGLYPGKVIPRHGNMSPPGSTLVTPVELGQVKQEALTVLNILHQQFDKGTLITNAVRGQEGGGGEQTATEYRSNLQNAMVGLDEPSRDIETTVFEPFLDMSLKLIYQFHDDYTLPRLIENFPAAAAHLEEMPAEERYVTMVGGFSFKARGLSSAIDQAARLGEIQQILSILANMPGLLQRIDPDRLLEKIFATMSWNTQELLLTPGTPTVQTPAAPSAAPGQPVPGAAPGTPGGGLTPMQQMNAQQGAQMGGARNNPNARPAGGMRGPNMPGGGGGPGPGQNPMAALGPLLQLLQGGRR
jgi:hypothetical protein